MDIRAKELTRLRGVGENLAARFLEAGIDSFEKVVAAGGEGLPGDLAVAGPVPAGY